MCNELSPCDTDMPWIVIQVPDSTRKIRAIESRLLGHFLVRLGTASAKKLKPGPGSMGHLGPSGVQELRPAGGPWVT